MNMWSGIPARTGLEDDSVPFNLYRNVRRSERESLAMPYDGGTRVPSFVLLFEIHRQIHSTLPPLNTIGQSAIGNKIK